MRESSPPHPVSSDGKAVGLAVTAALVEEEIARRGVDVVFLSAADDDGARIYERAGFRRVAHACIARAT
jgi:hypothetical protein